MLSEDEQLEANMATAAQNAASAVAESREAEGRRLAMATQQGIQSALRSARPGATVFVPPQQRLSTVAESVEENNNNFVGERPPPLAEGAYSEAPAQIQIVQQVPLLPLGTTVLGSSEPGGRPTLVVDTSTSAMAQQGLTSFSLPAPARPANLSNRGSLANRSGTRKLPRNNTLQAGPGIFNQLQAQGPPSSSARVTVNKLG